MVGTEGCKGYAPGVPVVGGGFVLLGPIEVRLEQVWICRRISAEAFSSEVCTFDGCDVSNGECLEVQAAAVDLFKLSLLESVVFEVRHEVLVVGSSQWWCWYVTV